MSARSSQRRDVASLAIAALLVGVCLPIASSAHARAGTSSAIASLISSGDAEQAKPAASASKPPVTGKGRRDDFTASARRVAERKKRAEEEERRRKGAQQIADKKTLPPSITDRRLVSACVSAPPDHLGRIPGNVDMCLWASERCNSADTPPNERRWYFRIWERQRFGPPQYLTVGDWQIAGYACYRPDEIRPDRIEVIPQRVLTWVDVYNAVRNERAAKKRVLVQPAGKTLVNAETIFSTSGDDWTKYGMVLLGFNVDVEGHPTSYLWSFGDGESLTTSSAGRPYPAKDVTHKYMRKAQRLGVTVTTTYKVRYRVDGGAWQDIEQPLVAVGPATPLGVREAIAVLVDPEG